MPLHVPSSPFFLHIWTSHCILIGLVVSAYGSSFPTRLCLCLYVSVVHHESHHHHSPSSSHARTRSCLHHYFDHHQQFPLRSHMHTFPYRRRYRISIVYCIYNTSSIRRRQSHPYLHHHWAPIHLHSAKSAFVFAFSSGFFIRIRSSFLRIVLLVHTQDPGPSASLHSKGPYALRSHRRTLLDRPAISPSRSHLRAAAASQFARCRC